MVYKLYSVCAQIQPWRRLKKMVLIQFFCKKHLKKTLQDGRSTWVRVGQGSKRFASVRRTDGAVAPTRRYRAGDSRLERFHEQKASEKNTKNI